MLTSKPSANSGNHNGPGQPKGVAFSGKRTEEYYIISHNELLSLPASQKVILTILDPYDDPVKVRAERNTTRPQWNIPWEECKLSFLRDCYPTEYRIINIELVGVGNPDYIKSEFPNRKNPSLGKFNIECPVSSRFVRTLIHWALGKDIDSYDNSTFRRKTRSILGFGRFIEEKMLLYPLVSEKALAQILSGNYRDLVWEHVCPVNCLIDMIRLNIKKCNSVELVTEFLNLYLICVIVTKEEDSNLNRDNLPNDFIGDFEPTSLTKMINRYLDAGIFIKCQNPSYVHPFWTSMNECQITYRRYVIDKNLVF